MTALVLLAVVSVGSWGARCDGERDDTVALQRAMDAAAGEAISFPEGVCLTGPLRLPDGTHLAGPGTLRLRDGMDAPLLSADQVRRIRIEEMTLDGNGGNQAGLFASVIRFRQVTEIQIRGSHIRNARIHGVWLDDGCRDFVIRGNRLENFAIGSAILLGNTAPEGQVQDGEVSRNLIFNVGQANGIFTIGSRTVGEYGTRNIRISGNVLSGVTDVAIEVGAASEDVRVDNNTVYLLAGSTTGIMVRSARRITVQRNTIYGTRASRQPQDGIFLWGHPLGNPDPTIAEEVTILDNYVRDCARYGIALHSGRRLLARNNDVGASGQLDLFVNPNGEPYLSDLLN